MTDKMINPKDAADIVRMECGAWTGLAETIIRRFKKLSTVDAVPVVRCGGCRYADWHSNGCIAYCTKHGTDGHVDDGFCSEGEKDGDSNDLRNLEPHPK